jgi:hypothetical protein
MRTRTNQASTDRTYRLGAAAAVVRCLVLTAGLAALTACGSITPARMVPDSAAAERPIAMQVHVSPVRGARAARFGGAPFPSNEALTQTVLLALLKVKAFAAVSEATGDVELLVSVLAQDQQGTYPTTARMVANYKFVGRNGDAIWSETYDTSFSAGDFGGAARTINAHEGAVRENVKAFVQGIRERWPSR